MATDTRKLRDIQRKIAKEVSASDELKLSEIKTIAGFDVTYFDNKILCAAIVYDLEKKEIIEKKHSISKQPMQYIPGYRAFRDGPAILQTYYDLESEPQVLMILGHGISHPLKCGLATFVGAELAKPAIGVAKKLLAGEIEGEKIKILNETRGELVKTKEHAKPLYISVGNMISLKNAVELVKKLNMPPHKLPEPLHLAHRHAGKILQQERGEEK
ncbi:endonuclease V [Candidatus Woesearchaeota archaeon]|nr:endonuclease V [Candidatus Woesearchaeota archaeon]MBW3005355.1 endonuclease V [Candidatus Woesearchaeota archaeon]